VAQLCELGAFELRLDVTSSARATTAAYAAFDKGPSDTIIINRLFDDDADSLVDPLVVRHRLRRDGHQACRWRAFARNAHDVAAVSGHVEVHHHGIEGFARQHSGRVRFGREWLHVVPVLAQEFRERVDGRVIPVEDEEASHDP